MRRSFAETAKYLRAKQRLAPDAFSSNAAAAAAPDPYADVPTLGDHRVHAAAAASAYALRPGRDVDPMMTDTTWLQIRAEAEQFAESNGRSRFGMGRFVADAVLDHTDFSMALATVVGTKMASNEIVSNVDYLGIFAEAFAGDPWIVHAAARDLDRCRQLDPSLRDEGIMSVFIFYKGFAAATAARVSNYFWDKQGDTHDGRLIARLLQSEAADVYGVDIHPGAQLGAGLTVDHATGIVIGETAVVGQGVYMMHNVTLGSTGTDPGHDRHPKIGDRVFLGAGCTVLGNIEVGDAAKIAAGAIVTKPVPARHLAIGIPARNIPLMGPEQV